MPEQARVIVVGGGLAGLAASVRVAEAGLPVDLFSMIPVKRSHSVCAQGGINACNDVARQQGYSEWQHMDETLYGGDFLNHQPPVYEMTHWAPRIIDLLDRMGVPFNRTDEGRRDLRMFGGSLYKRTHFAGATTGQQLLYALDEQTRRLAVQGKVRMYEFWEFLWPILNEEGVCKGIIAQDMRTMEILAFPADGVVMATGGCGLIFGKSTNSVICTGGAASRCYQAGAWLGNPEMIQVHPTAIPGEDKCRLMSESARGEGGRVWVPRKKADTRHPNDVPAAERWYFLEEKYPKYGNLVPRDIATREVFHVCEEGHGIGGGRMVYLDVTELPEATKDKLEGILEIYEKFTGDDPRTVPMKIFPAVHYTMGGLWSDFTAYDPERDTYTPAESPKRKAGEGMLMGDPGNMMTNIKGLYAFGEVNYQYHGATRLGANALLSCIFDGLFCGLSVANYAKDAAGEGGVSDALLHDHVDRERAKMQRLIQSRGTHTPYAIWGLLGDEMTAACTVVKSAPRLERALATVRELKDRFGNLKLSDSGLYTNQNLSFARALWDMLIYAEAIVIASQAREESRGSHYRSDFPERNDERFHFTTVMKYDAVSDEHTLEWVEVPSPLVEPRARTYGAVEVAQTDTQQQAADKKAEGMAETAGATGYDQRPTEADPVYGSAVDAKDTTLQK